MSTDRGTIRYHRGAWELSWYQHGTRRYRRIPGADTRAGRRRAEEELERLQATIVGVTVAELVEKYRAHKWSSWSPSTRARWESQSASILAVFGGLAAEDLTARWWNADDHTSDTAIHQRHGRVLVRHVLHCSVTCLIDVWVTICVWCRDRIMRRD